MAEVEVKILEIDVPAIQRRLVDLGAERIFEGDIQAVLYDFPDRKLDAANSFVRLRSKGDTVELVFKERIASEIAKSYTEYEVRVSDRGTMAHILGKLGLIETVRGRKKHRISYALPGVHFEIDTFDGMPTFLEIEVSEEAQLQNWVESLGFSMEDAKPWSGKDIYRHYGVEYPEI